MLNLRFICISLLLPLVSFGHGIEVLVFTKTAGFAHDSIPDGVAAITDIGIGLGTIGDPQHFSVTTTDDADVLVAELATHDVVVFLSTTGDFFNTSQEAAFEAWFRAGGGAVGIHAACDLGETHGWDWYLEMLGAKFANHPNQQAARVEFLDQVHPITNVIDPATGLRVVDWTVFEEWYNFTANPRGEVHVLATLDENSYTGGTHGDDHPIIWCQEFEGGRSAYLAPGHRSDTFQNPIFRGLIQNSIEWAAGELGGDSGATVEANFEKVVLSTDVSNPMSIDVAGDGTIYMVERNGRVRAFDQSTGVFTTIGTLDAYSGGEYGLLGIALALDFETSRKLFIHWSPNTGTNTRVSQFTLDGSGNLDLSSEVLIIEYLTNRPSETGVAGHHQAGAIRLDAQGDLYIGIGDNTQASGYSPRTPRILNGSSVDNIGLDARKASPNTNDLRGSIIRITPNIGGGPAAHPNYTIPTGNLFATGTPLTRPEIYAMGFRNPFRFMIDPITGYIYVGDVGPDANSDGTGAFEGTQGHDEFNQIKGPGWFGWPYYIADNQDYLDSNGTQWNSTTIAADLSAFYSSSIFTDSGAEAGDPGLLNNPEPAWIWYGRNPSSEFPETDFSDGSSGGRAAFAGAGYDYEPGKNFPEYYEGSIFLIEWIRSQILEVKTKPDGSILEITRFAPHIDISRPHDMVFGSDGIMYMLDYGPSFGGEGPASLFKIQYLKDASTPVVMASADVNSGSLPLTVNFSSAGSEDPDGSDLSYAWDFDGDGTIDSTLENPTFTYQSAGTYDAQLTITDVDELFARVSLTIFAGNNTPQILFTEPANYSFYDWGDTVAYTFSVSDLEDGTTQNGGILPSDVLIEAALGHGDHQHTDFQFNNLSGTLTIGRDDSHPFDRDLAYVFDAFYTDKGAPGVDPITTSTKVVLQPKVTMAQTFDEGFGVSTASTLDSVGGDFDVIEIDNDDYIVFRGIDLMNIDALRFRIAGQAGGHLTVRQDSLTGTIIASTPITSGTGNAYTDYTSSLNSVVSGRHDLYFIFEADSGGNSNLFKLNWINFRGVGATVIANRPTVSSVELTSSSILRIGFDQAMDYGTLANSSNFLIDGGVTISSVTPWGNQLGVDLALSDLIDNHYYQIEIGMLEDLAGDVIEEGSSVTFLSQPGLPPSFEFGLNAGGSNYTDASGNLYVDDEGPLGDLGTTLLVDFVADNASAVLSTVADFQAGDSNVLNGSTINMVMEANPTDLALSANGFAGVSLTQVNASGLFNTNKGSWNGVPILDGYTYSSETLASGNHPVLSLTGLSGIGDGEQVTLTLWGVGDTLDSDGAFEVFYNGSSLGTKTTDYDETSSSTLVQYEFTKVAAADSITVNWGQFGSSTTGLNGLALTTGDNAPYLITSGTNTQTSNDPISDTTDDLIYNSHRWNPDDFSYQIPVENGDFQLLLRLAETYFTAPNSRLFNISIENSEPIFLEEIDVFADAGHDVAYDVIIENVTVTDGVLNVDFLQGSENNPMISAIGVFRVEPIGNTLPDPSFARHLVDQPDSKFSATTDTDRDGLQTLLEYALGGDDAYSDVMRLPDLVDDGSNDFNYVFERPINLIDLEFQIEANDTLNPENWRVLLVNPQVDPSVDGMETVRFPGIISAAQSAGLSDPTKCFFRLKVSLQPIN